MPRTEPHYTQSPHYPIRPGDYVRALHQPIGEDHEGTEHTLPVGAQGNVDHIDEHGQIHVNYWLECGTRHVTQVYSAADGDLDQIERVCLGIGQVRAGDP